MPGSNHYKETPAQKAKGRIRERMRRRQTEPKVAKNAGPPPAARRKGAMNSVASRKADKEAGLPSVQEKTRKKAVLLSEAYKVILASTYPREMVTERIRPLVDLYAGPDQDITYAEHIGLMLSFIAGRGDVQAAREIRSTIEGEKVQFMTWQTEVINALKEGRLKPAEVIDEIGLEDAKQLLLAAGIAMVEERVPATRVVDSMVVSSEVMGGQ